MVIAEFRSQCRIGGAKENVKQERHSTAQMGIRNHSPNEKSTECGESAIARFKNRPVCNRNSIQKNANALMQRSGSASLKITEPGVYANITEAEYNDDPTEEVSLRSSIAWKLVERGSTPRHAWFACPRLNPNYKAEHRNTFDIGRACHAMLLGKGSDYAVIHHDNYKTKAAQEMRAAAYQNGKIPLLQWEAAQVKAMAKAAREQLQALVDAGTIPVMPFGRDETEVTIARRKCASCRAD